MTYHMKPHLANLDFMYADDSFGNLVYTGRQFSFFVCEFMGEDLH